MFYWLIGYKQFPEYFFNFVRFYVIIHQKIDLKSSSTYRCPFYWESEAFICWTNKKKNYHKIVWIAEITASQLVADRKGNAFIVEKVIKELLCFNFYFNHNYNKIVKSDWLSTALIPALIGQSVRVMPK